ncbi:uncharacterized protein LY89DRAFT_432668 [Mollisia scopiformis]|uniref:F-box domain-containing protein n=1 Tax=Mollisia scopiformis TaxID=149040 RepID=A0A194XMN4_MOLSC|nr:uncharacterized protein LY89DRAFT_432668 [Mollisia scopiformis]KUJ21391.1 hypothetical protein LY89DRAFT_432668 [Mollisia scopiformis]
MLLAHTRHLTVDRRLDWMSFSKLLSRTRRLESITWLFWEASFPAEVKEVLLKHSPDVKLSVESLSIGHRTDDEDVQNADLNLLKSLVGIPNVHTMKVEINYEHPVAMRWLKDVLLSSRNLETLHLTLPRNQDGRIDWDYDGLGVYDLCIEKGEQLESLKELVYEARQPPWSPKQLIPTSFFNWSKIHHLQLRGHALHYYVKYLHTQDVYFQTLSIEFIVSPGYRHDGNKFLDNFIVKLRGLEKLELATPLDQMPVDKVALHGDTLTSLSIRSIRRSVDPYSFLLMIPPYELDHLNNLKASCPHISSLALDLGIVDFMPYDFLVSLAQFPQLTTLRLYLLFAETGTCYYPNHDLLWPRVNRRLPNVHTDRLTVQHMFLYISMYKVGRRLEQLEVMMGDFPRSMAQITMRPTEPERPNILFKCHKDDDGKVVVEDDVTDDEDPVWDRYFKVQTFEATPGQAWQDNLEETIANEEEAGRVLKAAEDLDPYHDDDDTSLFGDF